MTGLTAAGLNCIWNTGKWSLISHKRIPLMLLLISSGDVKILSIRVAEDEVILVGLLMTGKSECEKFISANSLVGRWVEELSKFRL